METIKESEIRLLVDKLKKLPVSAPILFNWYVYLRIEKTTRLKMVRRIRKDLGCGIRQASEFYRLELEPWFEMMEQKELEYQQTEF